jgi:hypothetical protein
MSNFENPFRLVSPDELAKALGGLSEEQVQHMRSERKLFAVAIQGATECHAGYPIFQAWPGVAGEPLERVLDALGASDGDVGPSAYGFFSSPTELLDFLTPLEMLLGTLTKQRPLSLESEALLNLVSDERVRAVVDAARSSVCIQAAWD